MNRRTFLSALAGLPVMGKYWKPQPTWHSYIGPDGRRWVLRSVDDMRRVAKWYQSRGLDAFRPEEFRVV